MMTTMEQREFTLSLTMSDAETDAFPGAHAMMAVLGEPGEVPQLAIQAGGFPSNADGAGMLADMLRDAADAIDDHLQRPRNHGNVEDLPTVPVPVSGVFAVGKGSPDLRKPQRPRFNPKPRGSK